MDANNKRMLGHILVVEELHSVSGAKATLPTHDNITRYCLDSSRHAECVRTPAGNNTSTILNQINGTLSTAHRCARWRPPARAALQSHQ